MMIFERHSIDSKRLQWQNVIILQEKENYHTITYYYYLDEFFRDIRKKEQFKKMRQGLKKINKEKKSEIKVRVIKCSERKAFFNEALYLFFTILYLISRKD